MTENENIKLVRRWFEEVWNQRRLETIGELLATDAVAHDLGGPGATTHGSAAFRQAAEQMHQAFGEMHLTVEDIFGVDDRVAIRLTARLKHTGRLGELEPTGNQATVPVMCIVRIRNGQIIEGWNFWDVGGPLRAAKAPPEKLTLF